MSGSLKNLSEQKGAPAKAPSLIEVGTTRNEFGSLPNLQSQKNWHFALVRDGKDKTIRLKNGNRVFALRFDGDMTKDSYEKQQPVPLTRLGDLDEKDFLSGADVVSKGVFQVHRSTPNSIHGTLQDGKNNSSMIFEIGDDGKWMMRPKPKVRLAQLATKFVSNVGRGKQAEMKCPECGKSPGKYRIHGDAIQCGACEKTSDMERWDKEAMSAVLITGNPKYIASDDRANAFYSRLEKALAARGYDVSRDPGKPHTVPGGADIWVGHSRGADRLRFAPKETQTLRVDDYLGPDQLDEEGNPASSHYRLTKALRQQLDKLPKQAMSDSDKEIRKTMKVYAVDLDGTLAHNDGREFDPDHIGKPVPGMMRLVRLWLRRGHEVRIFTARAADKKNIPRIKEWLEEHDLKGRDAEGLVITNEKTPDVSFIYDDRAVQVEKNTGRLAKLSSVFVLNKVAVVEQEDDEWLLYTKDKSRVLGRHKKPEDAYKQEYAIQKSQERSKLGSLGDHFKTALSIPKIPKLPSGVARAPAMAGEVASAISNGTFIEGVGSGVNALEKGVNSFAGVTGGLDLVNTATKIIKPLGSVLAVNAPAVSSGLGYVAQKIAPPAWAASMAMQTGEIAAHPVESATKSHRELSETPLLGRVWAGASNPPKAIAGAAKGMVDAGGAVVDAVKSNLGAPMMRLKNWYMTSGPGSLVPQPIKKSGSLVGKYMKILRDRFASARDKVHPSPSEAQKENSNYRMGHAWMQGFDVTIETSKGGTRSGTSPEGKKWKSTLQADYGYIRNYPRSKADGDHMDVFVGPHPSSEIAFVIDQNVGGEFDECKIMLGFLTEKEAKETYIKSYDENWKGFRSLTPLTIKQLKKWLTDGDTSKPLAGQQYSDFLKTAEHDIQYPKIIGDIVHSDLVAKPAIAVGGGALRGMAVASIIHALRRAKRDAFDQSHRGLSLLKDLGTGAMIGAGTGLLAHAIPPAAEKLYDTFDVQPDSKLQKLSAHFMDVVLAPVNSTPGVGSVLGAGYGALAGGAKGIYRRTKGLLTGEPPEPDAIKNDIIDGMAQGANYGAYFGLTGPNPPPPPSNPKTKVVNTSSKLKKMRAVIPSRR